MANAVKIPDSMTLADSKRIADNHAQFRKESNELFDILFSAMNTVTMQEKALKIAMDTVTMAEEALKSKMDTVTMAEEAIEIAKATLKNAKAILKSEKATLENAKATSESAKKALNKCFLHKIYKVVLLTDEPVVLGVFPSRKDAIFHEKFYTNTSIEDCSTQSAHWANPDYIVTFERFCLRGQRQIETMVDPETCIGSGESFVTDFAGLSEKMKVTFKGINYTILSKQSITFYGEKIVEVGPIINFD